MRVMVADADGIRDGLRAVAADVLFRFGAAAPDQPIRAQAHNARTEVRITVRAANSGNNQPSRRVGSWMSPAESLICKELGADTLTRVDLAKRCGMPYDPTFKALVRNLIDRGILADAEDGKGVHAVTS